MTSIKEHPILMQTENVKAILDGRKTQTRRVMKPQPTFSEGVWDWRTGRKYGDVGFSTNLESAFKQTLISYCPYGQVGDQLWVRENWGVDKLWDNTKPSEINQNVTVWYMAGCNEYNRVFLVKGGREGEWVGRTRPSIFMPRWASRITLEITEVRVERLQEITEEDIKAEGTIVKGFTEDGSLRTPRTCFEWLWDSINAKRGYGWEVNPRVRVLSFKKVE